MRSILFVSTAFAFLCSAQETQIRSEKERIEDMLQKILHQPTKADIANLSRHLADAKLPQSELEGVILKAERDAALRELGLGDKRIQLEILGLAVRAQAGSAEAEKSLLELATAKLPPLPPGPPPSSLTISPEGNPIQIEPGSPIHEKISAYNKILNERTILAKRKAFAALALGVLGSENAKKVSVEGLTSLEKDQVGSLRYWVPAVLASDRDTGFQAITEVVMDSKIDWNLRKQVALVLADAIKREQTGEKAEAEAGVFDGRIGDLPADANDKLPEVVFKLVKSIDFTAKDQPFGNPEIEAISMLFNLTASEARDQHIQEFMEVLKDKLPPDRYQRAERVLATMKTMKSQPTSTKPLTPPKEGF